MTLGVCGVNFHLKDALRKRLKVAVAGTPMHAIAGYYPAEPGSGDVGTEVFIVGGSIVRIAPSSAPENQRVWQALTPIRTALREVLFIGERRLPTSCRSNRMP
jgi:hypothetical protein